MTAPPPIITSAQSWPLIPEEDYPSGVRSFAKLARASEWEVRIGFSRGYIPGQAKDSYQIRDFIGVWVNGFGRRAVALWERNPEAQFSAKKLEAGVKPGEVPSGMSWSTAGTAIMLGKGMSWPYASLTDLKEWIRLQGAVLPAWYDLIRAWVMAHEENARRNAKEAPAKAREREHA